MNQEQREHTSTFGGDGERPSVETAEGMDRRSLGGSAGDLVNRLPASLWSEERDVQELRSMAAGGAGGAVRRDGLWMSEEDKKQAAMKTIAHLQEWATKQSVGSAEPVRGNIPEGSDGSLGMGGLNGMNGLNGLNGVGQGYGMGRSVPQQGFMEQGVSPPQLTQQYTARHQQQQYHEQQQQSQYEYEYAAVLQRIIQDYLSGKQLTVVERQLLEQYIQMEQRKRMVQQQAHQQAHQQAQHREQEMAQRLYQEHLERMHVGRMHPGNGFRENGMGHLGGLGTGMGEMDGMMNSSGYAGIGGMHGLGGMASSGGVHMGGLRVGGPNGDGGVIGGGAHPESHGFSRNTGSHGQNYNGKYNAPHAPRRQAGAPVAFGNKNNSRPKPAGVNTDAGRPPAANPVQTLQEIGRTLSMLGITVEVAVNAGLLGGLSATDVRIVAEAHRLENELKGLNGNVSSAQRSNSLPVSRVSGHATSGESSPSKSPRLNSSFGNASAPTPSSPAWSTGSLSNPTNVGSLPSGIMYSENGANGLQGMKGEPDFSEPIVAKDGLQRVASGGTGRNGIGSSRSSAANEKSVSGGSIYTSAGDDQSYSATASGSASVVGDQQKDEDGERELKGFSEGTSNDGDQMDSKISSYLDSLSLGTGW